MTTQLQLINIIIIIIYCVVSGLYVNEISVFQLIGLHLRVIEVCMDVLSYCEILWQVDEGILYSSYFF